uniref:Uncharacterized protein n=1 Tax=Anguilla anguilla TaxID=7936 RepID=A0A0E9X5M8_ANGAN
MTACGFLLENLCVSSSGKSPSARSCLARDNKSIAARNQSAFKAFLHLLKNNPQVPDLKCFFIPVSSFSLSPPPRLGGIILQSLQLPSFFIVNTEHRAFNL